MKTQPIESPESLKQGDTILYKGSIADVIETPSWGERGTPRGWQSILVKTREHGNLCKVDGYDLAHFCELITD